MIKRMLLTLVLALLLSPSSECSATEGETLTVPEERSEATTVAGTEEETEETIESVIEESEEVVESSEEDVEESVTESSKSSENVSETVVYQSYDDTEVKELLTGILTHLQVIQLLLAVLLLYLIFHNMMKGR